MSSWLVEFFWFFKTILQTRLIRVRFRGKVWGLSKFPVPNERRTPNPPGTTKRWSQSCHFFSSEFRALKRRCGAKDPFCTSAKTMRIEGWRNLRFFLDVPEYTKVHFGSNYPTLISKKNTKTPWNLIPNRVGISNSPTHRKVSKTTCFGALSQATNRLCCLWCHRKCGGDWRPNSSVNGVFVGRVEVDVFLFWEISAAKLVCFPLRAKWDGDFLIRMTYVSWFS